MYAFEQGGVTSAGIVAIAQLVPAALFAPIAGVLADRRGAAGVLAGAYLGRAAVLGAAAASLLADGPPVLSYAFAAVAFTLETFTRPAQAVLTPALSREPNELTAFNVASGWIESACVLVAPALTGVALALSSAGTVFAIGSVVTLGSALAVAPLVRRGTERDRAWQPALAEGRASVTEEVAAGLRTLERASAPRLLLLVFGAQYVLIGAFDVLAVVLAIDVLGLGDGGAGYLYAALGAGGLVGAASTVALIGRRRLVPPLLAGAALVGASFVILGVYTSVAVAFVLLVIAGAGRFVVEVSGRTLLQRVAPPEVLSRLFALLEALSMAALAFGSILAPALVGLGGVGVALVAAGAVLPALVLLRLRALVAVDSAATVPIVEISLLRSVPIFARLPAPALETLARSLVPVRAQRGTVIIREGDPGDRFYAIADGEVEISRGGDRVVTRRRGEGFGEIALLREVPRTATATAATDVLLYALDREPFVLAVTGHAPAAQAADEIVRERSA